MAGFEILADDIVGRARVAQVRFVAPDGRLEERQLSWPSDTADKDVLIGVRDQYDRFLAAGKDAGPRTTLVGHKQDAAGE